MYLARPCSPAVDAAGRPERGSGAHSSRRRRLERRDTKPGDVRQHDDAYCRSSERSGDIDSQRIHPRLALLRSLRMDIGAPARASHIGTRTPILADDGSDIAAAIETIRDIGDAKVLAAAVADAFPESELSINHSEGRFTLLMKQHGLLRPLAAAELSDGTLRYLLWIAALLTPRPPV